VLGKISEFKESAPLIESILNRNLFKRAYYGHVKKNTKIEELRDEIERTGIKNNEYIINIDKVKGYGDDITVVNKKREVIGTLSHISPLVKTLMELLETKTTLLVAAKKDKVEIVSDAIQKVLID
jgi:HD superfamily phosphohydrolase